MIAPGLHASWRDVEMGWWTWPHFSPQELSCPCHKHCAGEYFHDEVFLAALETLRADAGTLRINSARRCPLHNAEVGGAPLSQHKLAIAVDVSLSGHDPVKLARGAVAVGFRGLGFGRTFLHLDGRRRRTAFHYPGGKAAWTTRFGFDPAVRFKLTGALDG